MYTLNDELIKGQSWYKDAVEVLGEEIAVTVEVNGYSYDIDLAENYLGGEGMEGFISEVMGNMVYDSAEGVILKTVDFLLQSNSIDDIEITF
ncbi:hypothetical protein SBP8a_276 [Bacillus phage SBP8a]|nr:hypothetical protein SBP8a_276 [Bacillus phage SBP8a]